jgi:hypothetical protein
VKLPELIMPVEGCILTGLLGVAFGVLAWIVTLPDPAPVPPLVRILPRVMLGALKPVAAPATIVTFPFEPVPLPPLVIVTPAGKFIRPAVALPPSGAKATNVIFPPLPPTALLLVLNPAMLARLILPPPE